MEKENNKNKWTLKKIGFVVLFGFFVIIVIAALSEDSTTPNINTTQNVNELKTAATLSIGEEGILNNNDDPNNCEGKVLMGATEDDFNAITKSSIAKDEEGLLELMMRGQAFLVDNCTRIRKIDSAGTFGSIAKIRILETQDTSLPSTGWVAYEFAIKKP